MGTLGSFLGNLEDPYFQPDHGAPGTKNGENWGDSLVKKEFIPVEKKRKGDTVGVSWS